MNLKDFSKYPKIIWNTSKHFLKENSPTILTGLGVAGVVTTAIMAANATPKALAALDKAYVEKNTESGIEDENMQDLTVLETLRVAAPYYAPSAIMGIATIGCIIGANSVNLRRNATLASLYSVSERTLKEYQAKTKEIVGEKKAQKIEDAAMQSIVNQHNGTEVIKTINGDTPFFDPLSGRYFTSSIEFVRKAQNDIKEMIFGDMAIPLNEFYYALGIPGITLGEDCGWNTSFMPDIQFTGTLRSDGTPCVALNYKVGPIYNYRNF